jgi:hypothetical protein
MMEPMMYSSFSYKAFALCTALIAAACGKVAGLDQPDAAGNGGGDGGVSIDATPGPDAQTHGTVMVTLRDSEGAPLPSTAVIYHAPDGSYLGSVLTNGSGTATIENMPIGGLVTAPVDVLEFGGNNSLTTVADVRDGDHIFLGRAPSVEPTTIRVTIPDQHGNATSYRVAAGCANSSTQAGGTVSINVPPRCQNPGGTYDAVAYAGDGTASASRLAFTTATGVTSVTSLPAWSTALGNHNVTVSGGEASVRVRGVRGGVAVDPSVSVQASPGTADLFRLASGFYDDVAVEVDYSDDGHFGLTRLRGITPPAAGATTATTVDLATDAFPRLHPELMMGSPLAVAVSPARAVTCRGGTTPDLLLAIFQGEKEDETGYLWALLHPGDRASSGVALPALDPAVAAGLWPDAQFVQVQGLIYPIGSTSTEWDDFRLDPSAMLEAIDFYDGEVTCIGLEFFGDGNLVD